MLPEKISVRFLCLIVLKKTADAYVSEDKSLFHIRNGATIVQMGETDSADRQIRDI